MTPKSRCRTWWLAAARTMAAANCEGLVHPLASRWTQMTEHTKLLSSRLWPQLRKLSRAGMPVLAAIGYYSKDQLALKRGDLLIVDACEHNIRSGSTSGPLLLQLFDRGVKLHHLEGLHAKVVVIGRHAVVGSANASDNSESHLTEAAFLTRDGVLQGQVTAFIRQLVKRALCSERHYWERLAKLEVSRPRTGGGKPVEVDLGTARCWWLATGPLSDALSARESDHAARGLEGASRKSGSDADAIEWIRYRAGDRIAKSLRLGDSVISAHAQPFGDAASTWVSGPFTVVDRQARDNWVRFYLERRGDKPRRVRLKTAQQALARAGAHTVTARSARLLSDDAYAAVTALLDKPAR